MPGKLMPIKNGISGSRCSALLFLLEIVLISQLFAAQIPAEKIMTGFVAERKNLIFGNSFQSAADFYSILLSKRLADDSTRLLFLLNYQKPRNFRPLNPNSESIRSKTKNQVFWHAVVMHNGMIFDPHCTIKVSQPTDYFYRVWQHEIKNKSFVMILIRLKDLPELIESLNDMRNLARYKTYSFEEIIANPAAISTGTAYD